MTMTKPIRIIMTVMAIALTAMASAQTIDAESVQARRNDIFGSRSYRSVAKDIREHVPLDSRNAVNYEKIIQLPHLTGEELFERMKRWAESFFNSYESKIRSVEKEKYRIVAQGYVNNVIEHDGVENKYYISLRPIITLQAKDGKVRAVFSINTYDVHREAKSNRMFIPNTYTNETWAISRCYPYEEIGDMHETTSAKALVMTHVCATMFMEVIENALKNKRPTTDDYDW
jgi:hypothetical protein